MMNTNTRDHLEMRWLPVTDASGRTRMEAVWIAPSAAMTTTAASAA